MGSISEHLAVDATNTQAEVQVRKLEYLSLTSNRRYFNNNIGRSLSLLIRQ